MDKPKETDETENQKKQPWTRKKKILVACSVVAALLTVTGIIVYFTIFFNPETKGYKPVGKKQVVYVKSSRANQANDTRLLTENSESFDLTFIVLEQNDTDYIFLAIPKHVNQNDIQNLRGLESSSQHDSEEESKDDSESKGFYGLFVFKADTNKGEITSFKFPPEAGESFAGTIKASAQSWLLNSDTEKDLLSSKRKVSNEQVKKVGRYSLSTTVGIKENDEYEIVTSTYKRPKLGERLLSEDPSLGINDMDIRKKSFVNKKTGNIDKTEIKGYANLDIISNLGEKQEKKQIEINIESKTTFEKAEVKLNDDDIEYLMEKIENDFNFENYDLDGSGNPQVYGNDTSESDTNQNQNQSESSSGGNGRSLLISETLNIKLFDILGVEVRMLFGLVEAGSNLKASASITVAGGLLSIDFGSYDLGSGVLSKARQMITLKNILEDNIKKILEDLKNYADATLSSYEQQLIAKFTEILNFLNDLEKKVTGNFAEMDKRVNDYVNKVTSKASEIQKKVEDDVKQKLDLLNKYLMENEEIKNLKALYEQTKSQLTKDYEVTLAKIKDIQENEIPKLEKLKKDATEELNETFEEMKNFNWLKNILSQYSSYVQELVTSIQAQLTKINNFESALNRVRDEVLIQVNHKVTLVKSQLFDYRNLFYSRVQELKKNLDSVQDRIRSEVDEKVKELNKVIDDYRTQIEDIDNQLKEAAESTKDQLLKQKAEIQDLIKKNTDIINNELELKRAELDNLAQQIRYEIATKKEELKSQIKDEILPLQQKVTEFKCSLDEQKNNLIEIYEDCNKKVNQLSDDLNNLEEHLKKTANQELLTLKEELQEQHKAELQKLEDLKKISDDLKTKGEEITSILKELENLALKSFEEAENELKARKEEIVASYEKLTEEIQSEIDFAKWVLEHQIEMKKKELEETVEELVKNQIQIALSDLQQQIDVLNALSQQIKNEVLEEVEKVKVEALDKLIEQRNELFRTYNQMEIALLFIAEHSVQSISELLVNTLTKFENIQESLQKFKAATEETDKKLKTRQSSINDELSSRIIPKIDLFSSAEKNITDFITGTDSRIKEVQGQLLNFQSISVKFEIKINEISLNITNQNSLIVSKNLIIEQVRGQYDQVKKTLDSILSGSYDWSKEFISNNFLQVRNIIEETLIKPLNDTLNTLKILKDTVKIIKDEISKQSSKVKTDSQSGSSTMVQSTNNVFNLPTSEKINSGSKLFDFKIFDDSIDKIKESISKMKTLGDNLGKLADSNNLSNLQKVTSIFSIKTWEDKLNDALNKFKTLETNYKIVLDYGDIKEFVLKYIQEKYSAELNIILESLKNVNEIISLVNDLSQTTLPNLLSSQLFKSTLINLLGPTQVITKNLYAFNKSWVITLPPIPTPVGTINCALTINARASVDLQTVLSLAKNSFAISPSGGLGMFASAGWNFVLGEVGAGADVRADSSLPVEVGFTFETTSFFVQGNFALSVNGQAGVFYKIITVNFGRKCWGRRWWRVCIPWITFSYSSPKWIISTGFGTNYQTAIIPYKVLKIGR